MSGTIQLRLTGTDAVIRAIYNRLCASSPRGPRGGLLYRCSLKERDHGIVQLYADLPVSTFGDLFGAVSGASSSPTADAEYPLFADADVLEASPAPSIPRRFQVDYRRK